MVDEQQISVVMPLYNGEAYVAEAIESVLSQPDKIELVVVDDSSTDNSLSAIKPYLQHLHLLHHDENQGMAAALNTGIAAATSPYLAFLDADDLFTENRFAEQMELLESGNLDIVYGAIEQFLSPDKAAALESTVRVDTTPGVVRQKNTALLPIETAHRTGPFLHDMGAGIDWHSRTEAWGARIGEVETVVWRRRVHGANFTMTDAGNIDQTFDVLRAHLARRRAAVDSPSDEGV